MKKTLGLALFGVAMASSGFILAFQAVNQPQHIVDSSPTSTQDNDNIKNQNFSNQDKDIKNNFSRFKLSHDFNFSVNLTEDLLSIQNQDEEKFVENFLITPISYPKEEVAQNQEIGRFQQIMQEAGQQQLAEQSMGEIMQAIAQQFLGARYKANLLDQSNEETLVAQLDKFDCMLFIETVLAIARGVATQDYSYNTFLDRIRDQRYRNGELNGYCSRLHYFSEWIADNQRRGTVQNISLDLGGVMLHKSLNFMSRHKNRYSSLVSNDSNSQCIAEMEANLAGFPVNYIPKNRIRRVYEQLQSGDIVAVATSLDGLDVTHTGLVYRHPNGNIGFIHASPIGVVTTARDLQRYVRNVRNSIGIIVVRPNDPRTLNR